MPIVSASAFELRTATGEKPESSPPPATRLAAIELLAVAFKHLDAVRADAHTDQWDEPATATAGRCTRKSPRQVAESCRRNRRYAPDVADDERGVVLE